MSRFLVLGLCALTVLPGCAVVAWMFPEPTQTDPSHAIHRAAMADFSTCATTTDPAMRQAMADRLAKAAATLQADTRPKNPDHFFLTDRVSAAATYCADSLR